MGRRSAGRTWRERQLFTLLQQEVSPEKIEREQDGEAVSRQNMGGKTALHLAAARGESREEREREQDGEAVSRQNMEGKRGLHLAAARGESREDIEGTGDCASPYSLLQQEVSPGKREQDVEAVYVHRGC
jgi:hypothetical protein